MLRQIALHCLTLPGCCFDQYELNHGNGNLQIATGREGKFEACNPGNHIESKIKFNRDLFDTAGGVTEGVFNRISI